MSVCVQAPFNVILLNKTTHKQISSEAIKSAKLVSLCVI